MNNLSAHKKETTKAMVEAKGYMWVFLFTHSLDLNPIEKNVE